MCVTKSVLWCQRVRTSTKQWRFVLYRPQNGVQSALWCPCHKPVTALCLLLLAKTNDKNMDNGNKPLMYCTGGRRFRAVVEASLSHLTSEDRFRIYGTLFPISFYFYSHLGHGTLRHSMNQFTRDHFSEEVECSLHVFAAILPPPEGLFVSCWSHWEPNDFKGHIWQALPPAKLIVLI